jgi:hypothetical protein
MSAVDLLRSSFVSLEVSADFSEAVLSMRDESRLSFCHRVGERWAKADGSGDDTLAGRVLARIALFRLNARHLDVQLDDGSRWEAPFGDARKAR